MDNVIFNLSHGMYVLTTKEGGCIVDAVAQISMEQQPHIIISVMKKNYTNKLLQNSQKAMLSLIGLKTNPKVISEFGYNSMKNYDKFNYENLIEVDGFKVLKDGIGYLELEKESSFENKTHDVFIFKVVGQKRLNDDKEMTYNYFKENREKLFKD